jgi:hypothetical protein
VKPLLSKPKAGANLKNVFSVLRQAGTNGAEGRAAAQYAMTADIPLKSVYFEALDRHTDELKSGTVLPVGSVEFVRLGMQLAGIAEPENLTYPDVLRDYLCREIAMREAGEVKGRWFVKPTVTKEFTGFVFDTAASPDELDEHSRAQHDTFVAMPADSVVWVSEPVAWLSEYRYYVVNGQVQGFARYDDGADDAPMPDMAKVREMTQKWASSPNSPVGFGLDVGVLASGETALVECNDMWALGLYRGSVPPGVYVEMLWARWAELVAAR